MSCKAQSTLQSVLHPGTTPQIATAPIVIPEYVRKHLAENDDWPETASTMSLSPSPLQRQSSGSSESLGGSSHKSKGARPHTPKKHLRSVFGTGVKTPIKSNRKQPGVASRRREIQAWEGKRIAEHLKAERVHFPNDRDFWRAMMVHYKPLTKEALQNIVRKEELFAQRMSERMLGTSGHRHQGSWGANTAGRREYRYRGCRAAGGGRKDRFADFKQLVKEWCETERSYGHTLTLTDLYLEFKLEAQKEITRLAKALKDCNEVEAVVAGTVVCGTDGIKSRLVELRARLARLAASAVYCKTFKKRLQEACGMRLLKAQRLVDISPAEEHARCQLTWQAFDQLLHLAAFGTPEKLGACIALPERFVQDRESIVLGFSDQVPVWVKVGQEKQLYCEGEVRNTKKDGNMGEMFGPGKAWSQSISWEAPDGMSQLRSHHAAGNDRYRVTVELCQIVTGCFALI